MAQELYEIFPAVFVNGGTTLAIQQLDSVEPDPQIQELIMRGGGSVDPLLIATAMSDPRIKMASRDIQTILAAVSISSGFYAATSGKIQYRQQANGSDYVSGSNHVTITSPLAYLYVEEFGAKQGDKEAGDISLTAVPLYNGTTIPLTVNVSQALTSSVAMNAVHHLGPVKIEGSWLGGVQSVRIKSGITVETKASDGLIFPTTCRIKERAPTIEIEAHNLSIMAAIGMNGTYPISSGFLSYLLKVVPGAGRYAADTSNHIATSVSSGVYKVTGITGSKAESAMGKITVMPTLNSMSINTATTVV